MQLAVEREGIEIVAVDSMQVYRRMDIGTAKPSAADQAAVPHHCLDLAEPSEQFTVTRYRAAFDDALASMAARAATPVLVAGTGLYLRAVTDRLPIPPQYPDVRAEIEADPDTGALYARLEGLDPLAASRMNPTNRRRVVRALEVTLGSGRPFSSFGDGLDAYGPAPYRFLGVDVAADELKARIAARLDEMLERGLLDEAAALRDELSPTARQALGYKELLDHLDGTTTFDDAVETIRRRTYRFAKRQLAWFRRDPRVEWRKPVEVVGAVLGDWERCRTPSTPA